MAASCEQYEFGKHRILKESEQNKALGVYYDSMTKVECQTFAAYTVYGLQFTMHNSAHKATKRRFTVNHLHS